MKKTPPPAIPPDLLDLGKALERLDGDREFLKDLFRLFREDGPARGRTMSEAVAEGSLPDAAKAAHSLKGMAGTISAPGLTELAYAMECAAKAGRTGDVCGLVPKLEAELSDVLKAIDLFLTQG